MKKIPLPNGEFAIVDNDDYQRISRLPVTWYYQKVSSKSGNRVVRGWHRRKKKTVSMHRIIMNAPSKFCVVNKNGDGLDNRKNNLVVVKGSASRHYEHTEEWNKKTSASMYLAGVPKDNTSGYKGVSWFKKSRKFMAYIRDKNNTKIHLGLFEDPIEAARVRDRAAKEKYGNKVYLNFPE